MGPRDRRARPRVAGARPQHARGSAGTTDPPLRQRSVILRPREPGSRRAERCREQFRPGLSSSLSQRCLLLRTTPVPPQAPPARPHLKSMPPNTTKAAVRFSTCEFLRPQTLHPWHPGGASRATQGRVGGGGAGCPPCRAEPADRLLGRDSAS